MKISAIGKRIALALMLIAAGALLATTLSAQTGILLNTFYVNFDGRSYNSVNDTTTYTYTVSGTGVSPDLSHFDLEIPRCLPPLQVVSYSPTDAVEFGVDPNTGIDGIKWGQPLKVDQSRTYSITFAGNWRALPTRLAVKDGDGAHLGQLPGPSCEPAGLIVSLQKQVRMEGMTGVWFNADEAPGLLVAQNRSVFYRFVITNEGTEDLTNITLTDDQIDVSTCIMPTLLAPGEAYTCEVGPFVAVSGAFVNTATVQGVMDGNTIDDTDSAYYLGINGPVLVAPRGRITGGVGNPVYQWTTAFGAASYEVYLARTDDLTTPVFFGTIDAATYCDDLLCAVDLTTLSGGEAAWLANGAYTVYLKANNQTTWYGAYEFTYNVPRPAAVTMRPVTETSESRPVFNWQLTGAAAYASWFWVYMAPTANTNAGVVNTWYSRVEACGSAESTTCSVRSAGDVANGNYSVYVGAWGPGGFAAGGLAGSGFAGQDFTVAAAQPSQITGLSADVAVSNEVTLTWTHDPDVNWYQLWVGTLAPTTAYYNWNRAEDLACDVTCTLTVQIPAGSYDWFLNGWGPGGLTQGGAYGGWAQGPTFTVR